MILSKLKKYLHYKFLSLVKPEIIGGFKNSDGAFYKNSRISNMTHISNRGNNLKIYDNVFIGHFNYIDAYNSKVTICKNVQITNYVNILTHSSHHAIRFFETTPHDTEKYADILSVGQVYIGENTYIGPHSVIMPGTHIGKGCIVSAYSYVSGDFPDFSVIRGQPAKVIGDTREIDRILLDKYPDIAESYYLSNHSQ